MVKSLLAVIAASIVLIGCAGTPPELGMQGTAFTPCPDSPNCVSTHSDSADHYIAPINVVGTVEDTKARLLHILKHEERTSITKDRFSYLRATVTSLVFRFVDDVEFLLVPQGDNTTVIHVRSASRVGHSDFGVNAARVERYRALLTSL